MAARLRELEDAGIIERAELPPPASRTVYQLTDRGWQQIPPILQGLARFGLDQLAVTDSAVPVRPLTGFLAGILMASTPNAPPTSPPPTRYASTTDSSGSLSEMRTSPKLTANPK